MNATILNTLGRNRIAVLSVVAAAAMITSAHADTVNVVNGDFQQSGDPGGSVQVASNQYSGITLPGWTATGYVNLAPSGGGQLLASPVGPSPNGGNVLELDGSSSARGSISQTLNGLTPGAKVTVSFEMAGGNYFFYPDSDTTEQLEVSLGGDSQSTPVLGPGSDPKGWEDFSFTFTADSASETLTFLSIGTPDGEPPISLLDGVSVTQDDAPSPVPEPGSLALLSTGLVGLGGFVRRRFK